MKKYKHEAGFTLLEMMVVVALLGIVTAIGLPSFRAMSITNELADTANSLSMAMKLARSEAISRGRDTIVCSSVNGSNCSGAAGNWNKGWIVGVDLDNDGTISEANGELLWAHQMDSDTQLTITPSNAAFDFKVDYNYTGWIKAGDDMGFDICSGYGSSSGYPRREIRASVAGDPRLSKNLGTKC